MPQNRIGKVFVHLLTQLQQKAMFNFELACSRPCKQAQEPFLSSLHSWWPFASCALPAYEVGIIIKSAQRKINKIYKCDENKDRDHKMRTSKLNLFGILSVHNNDRVTRRPTWIHDAKNAEPVISVCCLMPARLSPCVLILLTGNAFAPRPRLPCKCWQLLLLPQQSQAL